ncbi:carboxypeptidase-like regulatory domain-containing protein [Mucilaginibacter sp. KACC 22773]|uniref:carboxypeptidase-like regulatory domain-containing protein n=1 Tax=Mucilaginibacter sp. KACC 22773 TaxID=3025671 RepID=UPI0023655E44|nr:carboxypeptidase-like regulatory domain-containing protein [Mucilaginibacter sp. KACC 22773]WDF80491.1 carboxypeptidase-like regulatory domain-containing protein [Mucilaginibacter sp. KACC 22773]
MSNIQNINIPKPCHQSWQQMMPAESGRHCAQCCKTVTDFTTMTNSQIIAYLNNTGNVCGRFNGEQLANLNHQFIADAPATAATGWKRLALIMSISSFTLSFKAAAQNKPTTTEQVPRPTGDAGSFMLGKVIATDVVKTRAITGCIYDDQNLPIPGVIVKIPSGVTGTNTDAAGKFRLTIPADTKQVQVAFIGYKTMLVDICADENYQVKLTTEQVLVMGDIMVIRQPLIKRIYYKCIKKPIKKIFN